MPDSSEATSNKCFSAILSRLLCSGGLPTHPSDQFIESSTDKLEIKCSEHEESVKRGSNPGVVARLMGLESFPAAPPKERTLGDFFRSRSVNSIDFLSHFDPVKHGSRRHRRVRTSVSFREGLSDEFTNVVLLFEEELQGKMEEEKRRKNHGKNMEIQERRKSVYRKKVEIEDKRKSAFEKKELQGKMRANLKERRPVVKGVKCEEDLMGLKKKKSKILAHKLNCDFKKIQPEGTAPEVARRASRTKNQPSQTANSERESSCSNATFSDNMVERAIVAVKNERKMKINENFCNKKMVEEIFMVSEEDVREKRIYGMELKFEDFEEICRLFGQEILEVLLKQFVDDLVLNFGSQEMCN